MNLRLSWKKLFSSRRPLSSPGSRFIDPTSSGNALPAAPAVPSLATSETPAPTQVSDQTRDSTTVLQWYHFFKDGKPQMVRPAKSRGQAIEQLEVLWGKEWTEFTNMGYTCVPESDVAPEVWEGFRSMNAVTPLDEATGCRFAEYRAKINTLLVDESLTRKRWAEKIPD